MRRLAMTTVALALALTGCSGDQAPDYSTDIGGLTAGAKPPDLALPAANWINTAAPITLDDLDGKVVVAYFWRSSCVLCVEGLIELGALAAAYRDELVVLGIHSPKFPAEADAESVRSVLPRYGYDGPVANDPNLRVWTEWGISAWPTVAVLDPDGKLVGGHVGAGARAVIEPLVASLVEERGEDIDTAARVFPGATVALPITVLSFPEAVLADPDGGRLFIADTGHHRIVVADLATGDVTAVIGSGEEGRDGGAAATASFSAPRGMALDPAGSTLFVADGGNHLIRAVDLTAGTVSTLAGTGERGGPSPGGGKAGDTDLSVPWDLLYEDEALLITMVGTNQLWRLDLAAESLEVVAGSGRQGTTNGAGSTADLAAPTGLAAGAAGRWYFADAESSSIRALSNDGEVELVAGGSASLFDFGDTEATAGAARFQQPLGLASGDGALWVADTYNSKIKRIDISTGEVVTVAGSTAGWRDGAAARFAGPAGLSLAGDRLYVADRDNHSVRIVDTTSGGTSTLILKGIERLVAAGAGDEFVGRRLDLDPVEVGAGPGRVLLNVSFPAGYKANPLAPSRFEWRADGGVALLAPDADRSLTGPSFPLAVDATFSEGEGSLRADLWLVYCEDETESICLFDRARLQVPLRVTADGADTAELVYAVELPEGL